MRLIKYLIAIYLVYHFKLFDIQAVKQIFSNKLLQQKIFIGAMGYMLIDFLVIKRWQNMSYFRTHTHELTHSIAAMLTNKKVHQLAANEKDGHVLFSGSESWFVTLTPYFLPIYTLLFLPFRFFMQKGSLFWFDVLIIFTYAFHVHTFATDFSFKQPDIKKNGYFLSTIYVIIGNLFFLCLIALSLRK
jgi:hypothetical protein